MAHGPSRGTETVTQAIDLEDHQARDELIAVDLVLRETVIAAGLRAVVDFHADKVCPGSGSPVFRVWRNRWAWRAAVAGPGRCRNLSVRWECNGRAF